MTVYPQWLYDEIGKGFGNTGAVITDETDARALAYLGDGIVIAGTAAHAEIWRSTNYGLTWTDTGAVITDETYINALAYLGNGVVIAGTSAHAEIWRSTDYGVTWTDTGAAITGETDIRTLAYLGNGVVIAGTSENAEIWRSTDYGLTWTDTGAAITDETSVLSLAYLGNGIVVAGTYPNAEIWRSTNYGLTWTDTGAVITDETHITALAYLGNGIVIAGTAAHAEIWRSTDYGVTWTDTGAVITDETHINALAYLGNGIVIAGTAAHAEIWRSTDYGVTWTDTGAAITGETYLLSLAYLGNGIAVAGTYGNAEIWRSDLPPLPAFEDRMVDEHAIEDLADICTEVRLAHLNADIDSRSSHNVTEVWEKNISAFSGAGYAGTYLKMIRDDWLNGGRLDLILDLIAADVVNIADQVWDELLTGATHNTATSAGKRLRQLAAFAIHDGTAQAGATNTITLDAGASATDEIYNRNLCVLVGGTGLGQTREIVEYNGTTKVATLCRNWKVNPDATSEFQIAANDHILCVNHGYAQAGATASITLEAAASSHDNIYRGMKLVITTGTGSDQARLITAYNGTTKVATVYPAWIVEPDSTSVYHVEFATEKIVGEIDASPSAALVDAVWDELLSGHATSGTTGKKLSDNPTASAIADQVWDELQTGHTDSGSFGRYLDTAITTIAAAIGSGLLSCTWTQKDGSGNPMDNVQIWITTDEAGSNVVAGAIYTNTAGEVTFMLDAGAYYVWREKGGYNFTNPQTWTVS